MQREGKMKKTEKKGKKGKKGKEKPWLTSYKMNGTAVYVRTTKKQKIFLKSGKKL